VLLSTAALDAARRYVGVLTRASGTDVRVLMWVPKAYETQGFAMLLRALTEAGFLETLTGLDKLHAEGHG
jgi:hypothetical protein